MQKNVMCICAVLVITGAFCVAAGLPENYLKRWDKPDVQKRINDGIEKNRKSDMELVIVDAAGKPVPNAEVKITQQSHEFLFGCNLFVLGQMEEKEQAYRDAFLKLFNAATIPFYWRGTEPAQGTLRYEEGGEDIWRRPPPDRLVAFAKEHGLTMRGHPLLWFQKNHNPTWLPKDPAVLKELYRKRFREIAERYADDIQIWDVANESQIGKDFFPLHSDAEQPHPSYVPWAFELAGKFFRKDNQFMINDVTKYNWPATEENTYYQQCAKLIADGVRVEGIGFQFHHFNRERLDEFLSNHRCDPNLLLDNYEMFAGLGQPLQITEITIGSEGEDGDAIQERVVRDLYRLWFSAPKMEAIIWWNLGDGTAHGKEGLAKGGLTHKDFQPKPAYRVLDQLINHDWKTKMETTSNQDGRVTLRGFHGNYKIAVAAGGKTKEFDVTVSSGEPARGTLTLP